MGDRIMKDRIMKKNGPHDPVIMPGRDVGIQFTCSKVQSCLANNLER